MNCFSLVHSTERHWTQQPEGRNGRYNSGLSPSCKSLLKQGRATPTRTLNYLINKQARSMQKSILNVQLIRSSITNTA